MKTRRHRRLFHIWIDRTTAVTHPTEVMGLARRIGAVAIVVAICVGNLAVCAGWQATPEARMACCTNRTSCPMHGSDARASDSVVVISQAQADGCCAGQSSRTQSSVADSQVLPSKTIALATVTNVVVPVTVPALQAWRTVLPRRVSPVPQHLVLSILLI